MTTSCHSTNVCMLLLFVLTCGFRLTVVGNFLLPCRHKESKWHHGRYVCSWFLVQITRLLQKTLTVMLRNSHKHTRLNL
ncbi:mCG58282 [Mus musculus]|nr:mCG58282 [Mus musculus]